MANIYYIPAGPKNLTTLFPAIDFNRVEDYFIEILDGTTVMATTPLYKIGCCCGPQDIAIRFFNYLGHYDTLVFSKPKVTHDPIDQTYQMQLPYPLKKTSPSLSRFGIKSNDTQEANQNCYGERESLWIQELFDSPLALLQWTGTEGQSDDYIPIVILNSSFEKQKNVNDYQYMATIKFKYSNEFQTIRN